MSELLNKVKELIGGDKVLESIDVMEQSIDSADVMSPELSGIKKSLLLNKRRYNEIKERQRRGEITDEQNSAEKSKISSSLMDILDEIVKYSEASDNLNPEIKSSNGIIKKSKLKDYNAYLPDEVFAAELLWSRILLKKTRNHELHMEVDRRRTEEYVISNSGKKYLNEKYVKERQKELKVEDNDIHDFILNGKSGTTKVINHNESLKVPFRWLSGGVLSIVVFKGRKWIPFFFRDIKPYGWNISLGGSERQFQEEIDEYRRPWHLILREFIEETLVLDKKPEIGESPRIKRFYFGDLYTQNQDANLNRYADDHIELREGKDFLNLIADKNKIDPNLDINVQTLPTDTTLIVKSEGTKVDVTTGVLISINLLELGIEIIKVLTYRMDDDDYLLDGEILSSSNLENHKELVRMPCALISLDFLRDKFQSSKLKYTDDNPPSIIMDGLDSKDIHIFDWDIRRRWELIQDENTPSNEKARYIKWKDKFGDNFQLLENGMIDLSNIPNILTPTSAKVLQYYFNSNKYL